ncbi:Sec63 Brl domain-containing protein [Radiomyces spectabilis]|uniref:Sec63 Brl domain-containing protein n=1 Tax=Radiomyces spectabilis TaxID=64574 RepID=UPI00221F3837|nr:Sec63 Brl domain-containing protein [Radiomyces spectabilis]KAI8388700.1 Sec63 Brl domain-containing protein [Radiomyces spectabilis]
MIKYTYDEHGFAFYYFILSTLLLCLVPATIIALSDAWKNKQQPPIEHHSCACRLCQQFRSNHDDYNSAIKKVLHPKKIFLVMGWIVVGLLLHQVSHADASHGIWNPYEILGIHEDTPMVDIKHLYKKLSLTYHPDKAQPGSAEEHKKRFMDITAAYKVLTDHHTRKNYETYGHPDGPRPFSMGIALPKILVEGSNRTIVLGLYGLVFGLGLPLCIIRWWFQSRRLTKDKILHVTMSMFVKELKEDMDLKAILEIIFAAKEFEETVHIESQHELEILEMIDTQIAEQLDHRSAEKYSKDTENESPSHRKARTLLYAYLLRLDFNQLEASDYRTIRKDQREVVKKTIHLLRGLSEIAKTKQWLKIMVHLMEMKQYLIQAIYPGEPPILQLPHITAHMLSRYQLIRNEHITTIQQFLGLSESDRQLFLEPLTEHEREDAMHVAETIPKLCVSKAAFKVSGEDVIAAGSIIHLILQLRKGQFVGIDPVAKAVVEEKAVEPSEENSDEEEMLDIIEVSKKIPTSKLPYGHSPYCPIDKKPKWWVFLGDPKVDRMLVHPRILTDISDVEKISIPFAGPPHPGTYTFSFFLKSDTYCGMDIIQDIKLTVRDPNETEDDKNEKLSERRPSVTERKPASLEDLG